MIRGTMSVPIGVPVTLRMLLPLALHYARITAAALVLVGGRLAALIATLMPVFPAPVVMRNRLALCTPVPVIMTIPMPAIIVVAIPISIVIRPMAVFAIIMVGVIAMTIMVVVIVVDGASVQKQAQQGNQ
ncbi:hypothetical protein ACG10_05455 [Azotobacter chroococcum]|nr:hypothetical protein ACG10_05455 [Azotobacter chroococcum]